MKTVVFGTDSCKARTWLCIRDLATESIALKGSSRIKIAGSVISARTISIRRCMP